MNDTRGDVLSHVTPSDAKVSVQYGIAIVAAVLILISTVVVACYACFRLRVGNRSYRRRGATVAAASLAASLEAGALERTHFNGIDDATLESYPKIQYHEGIDLRELSCSICLSEYKAEEVLRLLPDCRHTFHASCIDAWLRLHATCPMCRSSPVPTPSITPGATPLSELIPLSRNPLSTAYTIHHYP
ncbi:hypothetical protein KP509_33G012100 [Ceratopteris richardii]|uniref:RING-type E3 ubiquitin transferase n=1 Tax=Ceratopteris richardii TaxID=49495 RepID=A0A8T2QNF6_CERRI|nr:hypothetical protein KP509_33G012100 [Ceratopteris richardii]